MPSASTRVLPLLVLRCCAQALLDMYVQAMQVSGRHCVTAGLISRARAATRTSLLELCCFLSALPACKVMNPSSTMQEPLEQGAEQAIASQGSSFQTVN